MFRIKICGVKSAVNARGAAAAGADAIGLNFFAGSRRYLPPEAATNVAAAIPRGVLKVGVFVNATAEFVLQTSDRLGLDLIQLAGDETPQFIFELRDRAVMKAFRPELDVHGDREAIVGFLAETEKLGCVPKLVLIDAHHPGEFGGTGKAVNWPMLSRFWNGVGGTPPPLVLAGGLNHENVREAIETVRPAAVDVASGVESSPSVKDAERMRRFVAAALSRFDSDGPPCPQASPLKPQASSPPSRRPA